MRIIMFHNTHSLEMETKWVFSSGKSELYADDNVNICILFLVFRRCLLNFIGFIQVRFLNFLNTFEFSSPWFTVRWFHQRIREYVDASLRQHLPKAVAWWITLVRIKLSTIAIWLITLCARIRQLQILTGNLMRVIAGRAVRDEKHWNESNGKLLLRLPLELSVLVALLILLELSVLIALLTLLLPLRLLLMLRWMITGRLHVVAWAARSKREWEWDEVEWWMTSRNESVRIGRSGNSRRRLNSEIRWSRSGGVWCTRWSCGVSLSWSQCGRCCRSVSVECVHRGGLSVIARWMSCGCWPVCRSTRWWSVNGRFLSGNCWSRRSCCWPRCWLLMSWRVEIVV